MNFCQCFAPSAYFPYKARPIWRRSPPWIVRVRFAVRLLGHFAHGVLHSSVEGRPQGCMRERHAVLWPSLLSTAVACVQVICHLNYFSCFNLKPGSSFLRTRMQSEFDVNLTSQPSFRSDIRKWVAQSCPAANYSLRMCDVVSHSHSQEVWTGLYSVFYNDCFRFRFFTFYLCYVSNKDRFLGPFHCIFKVNWNLFLWLSV